MTTTAAAHDLQHAPSPTGGVRRLLLGPGLLRGAWMFVLFGWIGFGIVVLIFQEGHGSSLWNITATQSITARARF